MMIKDLQVEKAIRSLTRMGDSEAPERSAVEILQRFVADPRHEPRAAALLLLYVKSDDIPTAQYLLNWIADHPCE